MIDLSAIKTRAYVLANDEGADLAFRGKLIAEANSTPDQSMGSLTGVWQELALYKTEGGHYVCSRVTRTQWQGSRDKHEAYAAEHQAEESEFSDDPGIPDVISFFGHSWLAKDLYSNAGIPAVRKIA